MLETSERVLEFPWLVLRSLGSAVLRGYPDDIWPTLLMYAQSWTYGVFLCLSSQITFQPVDGALRINHLSL